MSQDDISHFRQRALLDEALQIVDGLGDRPEFGAGLHGIIEALRGDGSIH